LKKGKIAFFVTGNVHKFHEARAVLRAFGISTAMLNFDATEIQADDIDAIARFSALEASKKTGMAIFVEDAGLFIDALKGFPGPYSSYVYQTLGTKGILRLMQNTTQRNACFHSAIAFSDSDKNNGAKLFHGRVNGKIVHKEQGSHGFGFDPIFEPSAELGTTFAEMTQNQKNRYSHRAEALRKLGAWYAKRYVRSKL
jgi:XTP/dITP diphosphohydrolase